VTPRPRRRRRWLAIIGVFLVLLSSSGFAVLRVEFEGPALADKISDSLNKKMRGRIEIGSIEWDASDLKKALTGGWVPLTVHDIRVWDDCALNSGADAVDEIRLGDPNEDCTLDDRPDPDPGSKRRPRKLLLRAPLITAEVDIHALMFGNHDFVFRNLWVHGGEALLEQTNEPYPLHAYDRTIVSIVTAFYPRMKAGFRAGIHADPPGPIFDLRDIHIKDLNLTIHMGPYPLDNGRQGYNTTARLTKVNIDSDPDPEKRKNTSYLYMDPVDPLVAKFYVRLEVAANSGTVRALDEGPREAFRLPRDAGELYPPPGRESDYQVGLTDVRVNRLAQLPTEWPRKDFVANTLEVDLQAKTVACGGASAGGVAGVPIQDRPTDPKHVAHLHVTGELFNYWDRPYDGLWNLSLDARNLGHTIHTCIKEKISGDSLDGKITVSGPFVALPKINLSLKNVDFDIPIDREDPLRLTLAEVEGNVDMVNEQGALDKTTALIRGGKEPGEVVVSANFGLRPWNARASLSIVKPIDVGRFLPEAVRPVGTLLKGDLTAVGDADVGFSLEKFDLSIGRTEKEKAVRVYNGRLFTSNNFDTLKIQQVNADAGRTRVTVRGTVDLKNRMWDAHDPLVIRGEFPDLGEWLKRFGLPDIVKTAGGGQIVVTGPISKPIVNVATELGGIACLDKVRIIDSQYDSAKEILDIRRLETRTFGGTLTGSARIKTPDKKAGRPAVIEKMHVDGKRLDAAKICGLAGIAKGTVDTVDADLAGTVDPNREPLDWLNLAKVHARADRVEILGDKFTNVAMCVNRRDDHICRPRTQYLDTNDLQECEQGKRNGFCAVATATRDGGGTVDATVARLPPKQARGKPQLAGTVALSDVPVAILDQLLGPPAPAKGKKPEPREPFPAGGLASLTLHLEGTSDAPQASGAIQLLRSWVFGAFLGDAQIAVRPGKLGTIPGLAFEGVALAGRLQVSGTLGTQAPYPVELVITGRRLELDVLIDLQKRLKLPLPTQAWITGTITVRHELKPNKPVEPEAWIELSELTGIVTHRGTDGRIVPLSLRAVDQDRAKRPAVSLRVTPTTIDFACRDPKTGTRSDCTTKLAIGPQGGQPAGVIDFRGHLTENHVAVEAIGKLDLAPLAPLVESQFSCMSGTADVSASISGSYTQPSYEASLSLNRLEVTPVGGDTTVLEAESGLVKLANGSLGFTNVKVRVRDTHRDAAGTTGTGTGGMASANTCAGKLRGTTKDEAGELFVKGNIALDGLTPKSWGLLVEGKIAGKMLGLLAKDFISQASGLASIQGDLLLTGRGPRPNISGTLVFDQPPTCPADPVARLGVGDCLAAGEQWRPISLLPRHLRREISIKSGSLEIETAIANDRSTYKVSVLKEIELSIDEGTVKLKQDGYAEIRDGNLAKLGLRIDADNLQYKPADGKLDVAVSARNVSITRATETSKLDVAGRISLIDGSFTQDFELAEGIRSLGTDAPPATPLWDASSLLGNAELNLLLDVRRFSITGNILKLELSGENISLTETPRDPRLSGSIRVGRGEFRLPGMRARFTRTTGQIAFNRDEKAGNPDLKINSEADYRDLTGQDHVVTLTIEGYANALKWDLRTSTGYNKSQTVSLLLLGRNQEQLRRSLGDQMLGANVGNIDPTTNPTQGFADQIVKDLAGDWVSDLLENSLTKLTGLDVLRIEVGFGSIGLHLEKKLAENLNSLGTFEQTIRGNTINVRAEVKTPYKVTVQGGYLGKNFNDPAEQDITDYSVKAVIRLLP
jgi:hypothetical protein